MPKRIICSNLQQYDWWAFIGLQTSSKERSKMQRSHSTNLSGEWSNQTQEGWALNQRIFDDLWSVIEAN